MYLITATRSGLSIGERYINVNKLSTMMKSICQEGGLNGNVTNHSGKRIYVTEFYEVRMWKLEIMARTRRTIVQSNPFDNIKEHQMKC